MTGHKKYIPEIDYAARDYKPLGGPQGDMCARCKAYYKKLYESKITDKPFVPVCKGHVLESVKNLSEKDFESRDEYEEVITTIDPVSWAMKYLGWEARWYQEEILSCTSKYKVIRAGRRIGKTLGACVGIIHKAFTNPNFPILVVAPYEPQVDKIFFELLRLIKLNPELSQSVKREVLKNPTLIELKNGSRILGFCAGDKASSRSDKIRGQDAKLIYIDEMDYVDEKDINAVAAILASHPDCELWCTSTPSGAHQKFYQYNVDKNLGYKEFHFIAQESPTWTEETERYLRREYGAINGVSPEWSHEILAEFGDADDGVYKNRFIDASLMDYSIDKYEPSPNEIYIAGVDWNKNAGTHIIICSVIDNLFRPVLKVIVPKGEFTQTKAVETIIDLFHKFRFKTLTVDAGYGDTQVEMLKMHSLKHSGCMLHRRLIVVTMQEKIIIPDPETGEKIRKNSKVLMVNLLARELEKGNLILPVSEDTLSSVNDENMGLVQQMRNYHVLGYTPAGMPKYSQGPEHTLTAFQLAVGGYILKYGDIKVNINEDAGFVAQQEPAIERQYLLKKKQEDERREEEERGMIRRSAGLRRPLIKHTEGLGSIREVQRKRLGHSFGNRGIDGGSGFRRTF